MSEKDRQKFLEEWKRKHPKPSPKDLVDLVRRLGHPTSPVAADFDPDNIRCACNKLVPCENAALCNTGIMDGVEPVCPPCRGDFAGQARLFCVRCRMVIGWMEPQTDPHGFKIEPDKFYHVAECAVCKKGLQKADIIEMMLYYDEMGIPYPKDILT